MGQSELRIVSHACGQEGTTKLFFFFQAEDGIRDYKVTGVQTCALPILTHPNPRTNNRLNWLLWRAMTDRNRTGYDRTQNQNQKEKETTLRTNDRKRG